MTLPQHDPTVDAFLHRLEVQHATRGVAEALRSKLAIGISVRDSFIGTITDALRFGREHGMTTEEMRNAFLQAALAD